MNIGKRYRPSIWLLFPALQASRLRLSCKKSSFLQPLLYLAIFMQLRTLKVAVLAALMLPGVALASKVTIVNKSSWDITHVYVSPSKSKNWGEDHLEDKIH